MFSLKRHLANFLKLRWNLSMQNLYSGHYLYPNGRDFYEHPFRDKRGSFYVKLHLLNVLYVKGGSNQKLNTSFLYCPTMHFT